MKPSELRQILVTAFSDSELRDLSFDLGVDYDVLPGTSKLDKARELVVYFQRRGQLHEIETVITRLRPSFVSPEVEKVHSPPQVSEALRPTMSPWRIDLREIVGGQLGVALWTLVGVGLALIIFRLWSMSNSAITTQAPPKSYVEAQTPTSLQPTQQEPMIVARTTVSLPTLTHQTPTVVVDTPTPTHQTPTFVMDTPTLIQEIAQQVPTTAPKRSRATPPPKVIYGRLTEIARAAKTSDAAGQAVLSAELTATAAYNAMLYVIWTATLAPLPSGTALIETSQAGAATISATSTAFAATEQVEISTRAAISTAQAGTSTAILATYEAAKATATAARATVDSLVSPTPTVVLVAPLYDTEAGIPPTPSDTEAIVPTTETLTPTIVVPTIETLAPTVAVSDTPLPSTETVAPPTEDSVITSTPKP